MSKVHPGESSTYAYKLQKRAERAPDRKVLKEAKRMFYEEHGN